MGGVDAYYKRVSAGEVAGLDPPQRRDLTTSSSACIRRPTWQAPLSSFETHRYVNGLIPHREELAGWAAELGYRREFDDDWANQVADDALRLGALLAAAADGAQAVILKINK
jgi:hypothetical protein